MFFNQRHVRSSVSAVVILALATMSQAQQAPPAKTGTAAPVAPAAPATTQPDEAPPLKPEEIEQVVASIALYPDSLLAQVLMASTYPLEVVQADRWAKANKTLKDKALADALNKQSWDASVKSLVNFPQVLTMMSEKLDWTMKLGDAFIADQKSVMDAVQRLRAKAQANGALKSNKEQTVKTQTVPASEGQPATQVIVVESSSPNTIYVPTYNPTVVYGGWPYPSYPPYSYYPPGYVAGTAMLSFGVGVAMGAAWGHAWGGCNWGHGEVDVDIDQNVNFNNNIDRDKAKAESQKRQADRETNRTERQGGREANRTERQGGRQGGANSFQHDPSHRKGVSYRDNATSNQMRGTQSTRQTSQARDSYRGRAEAGRQDISRGGASDFRGSSGAGAVNRAGSSGSSLANRSGSSSSSGNLRSMSGGSGNTGTRSSSFSGVNSGSSARQASSRGQSSRSSSNYSRSSAGSSRSSASSGSRSSGGSRSMGGGSRGGGGRGGGRR